MGGGEGGKSEGALWGRETMLTNMFAFVATGTETLLDSKKGLKITMLSYLDSQGRVALYGTKHPVHCIKWVRQDKIQLSMGREGSHLLLLHPDPRQHDHSLLLHNSSPF